jgi:hypothetical protein
MEMELGASVGKLGEHGLDARLDRRMVRSIPGDELFDNGAQGRG